MHHRLCHHDCAPAFHQMHHAAFVCGCAAGLQLQQVPLPQGPPPPRSASHVEIDSLRAPLSAQEHKFEDRTRVSATHGVALPDGSLRCTPCTEKSRLRTSARRCATPYAPGVTYPPALACAALFEPQSRRVKQLLLLWTALPVVCRQSVELRRRRHLVAIRS